MKQFEKLRDKVALVGFAPTTRDLAPFDDDEYEIWTVNEAGNIVLPAFSWVKRFDRLFQMHPRWDFSRENNGNDPNHFHWLQNITAPCLMCKSTGMIGEQKCPACSNGTYSPPISRTWPTFIYMQDQYKDIPNSVKYPLDAMVKMNPRGRYFDSSAAYMINLAAAMQYKEIYVIGFEMAAQTEYYYQRANFEYLVGLWTARGTNFKFPKNTTLLCGPLYGYENMKTGYRQNLDIRMAILTNELAQHNRDLAKLEGEMEVWAKLSAQGTLTPPIQALAMEAKAKYSKLLGLVNLVNGAKYEAENLRKLYDTYFMGNEADGRTTMREDQDNYVKTIYGAE
jgi:hypothetical protein